MENRCVCCQEIIPEGQQVCRQCMEGGSRMMKNGSGAPDPTFDQALWGIRREERIRELEKKYNVKRNSKITVYIRKEKDHREPGKERVITIKKKMKVVSINTYHITLEDENGFRESFQWRKFEKMRKRK